MIFLTTHKAMPRYEHNLIARERQNHNKWLGCCQQPCRP